MRLLTSALQLEGGELEASVVAEALEPMRAQLQRCYENALKRHPTLAGRFQYTWVIRGRGRVALAKTGGKPRDGAGVRACGLRALERTRFPRPGKRAARVRAVFQLTP